MGAPLEIAGAHKRTEKGNVDEYYGGGSVAYTSTAAACAFVPLAIREGKTVGIWENNQIVEYIWHIDTSNSGLTKKPVLGPPGAQGPKGEQGVQGLKGEKGDTGADGAQGPKGDQGIPGIQGLKGDAGVDGAQGPKGDQGISGAQGPKGEQGLPGADGAQGPKGDQGTPGTQGQKGDAGADGAQGQKGDRGMQGPPGAKGDPGANGAQGPKGDQGVPGIPGPVNIATDAEMQAGTDDTKAVTPLRNKTWWNSKKASLPDFDPRSQTDETFDDDKRITPEMIRQYFANKQVRMVDLAMDGSGTQQGGISWTQNSDYGKVFFYTQGDGTGTANLIIMSGDDNEPGEGVLILRDVTYGGLQNGAVVGNTTVKTIAGSDKRVENMRINLAELKYLGWDIWHQGNIEALNAALNGSPTGGFDKKEDKLIGFYTTQTASFNISADMVDKTVQCNHATAPITATIADDSFFAIGAKFVIRQSGAASVTLAAVNPIVLNAPQGAVLTKQHTQMLVIKQATNIYSVFVLGDDITKLSGIAASDLETQITTTMAEDNKFVSRSKLFNWFAWVKGQGQAITARWTFSLFNLIPGADPATPSNGDVWVSSANTLRARLNGLTKTLMTAQTNPSFIGSGERVMSVVDDGSINASTGIIPFMNVDVDVATALNVTTFPSNSIASITPANNKIFYEGQFANPASGMLYLAIADNYVFKIK